MILFILNYWRYLLMAALLAYGAFWQWRANVWEGRYEAEVAAFQTFKAEVKVLGDAAKKAADEKKAKQDGVTRKVDRDYKDTRNRVDSYYGGLRLPADNSRSGVLPPAADSAKGSDGPAEERAPSGEGVTLGSCALDAAQVMAWQEWAREQGFPVD